MTGGQAGSIGASSSSSMSTPLSHHPHAPSDVLTIVFTDVERSTELSTRAGEAAARSLLGECARLARREVEAAGGRVVRDTGDGLLLTFASPRRALACAVGIQRAVAHLRRDGGEALRVRIGVSTGEVVEEGGQLHGEAVNAAARIVDKAQGGEILVADVVRRLAGTVADIEYVDRGSFRLKGFPERWRLYAVAWQPPAAEEQAAERTPLVGRDAEREKLRAALQRTAGGGGSSVAVLLGEPGIGKTRLTEELSADARRLGARVLTGRSVDTDLPVPYMPFVEAIEAALDSVPRDELRAALGEVGGEITRIVPRLAREVEGLPRPLELPADNERLVLFDAVCALVAGLAARRPLLLVLDDLHWADASTLLLVEHLSTRLRTQPVMLLAAARDEDLGAEHPLARLLDTLMRRRIGERIDLRRLDAEGIAGMVEAMSGQRPPQHVVAAIASEAEGNPFFVEEVYRFLQEDGRLVDASGQWQDALRVGEVEVPSTVRHVITRRLQRLSPQARTALASVAVVGRSFDVELLAAVAQVDDGVAVAAVDEAEGAGIVLASGRGRELSFAFAHELTRQTLLATELSTLARQRLHLRAADVLEQRWGAQAEEHAAELANHLDEAGSAAPAERTVEAHLAAARSALGAAAFEEALAHLEVALPLATGDAARAALLELAGSAHRGAGRMDQAVARWEEALSAHAAAGDRTAAGRLYRRIAGQLMWAGRPLDALGYVGRGLELLGADRDSADRVRLVAQRAQAMSFTGSYADAAAELDEALQTALRVGDRRATAEARMWTAYHHWFWVEYPQSAEQALLAAADLRRMGAMWELGNALTLAGLARVFAGETDAGPLADESLAVAARTGHMGTELSANRVHLFAAARRGDLDALGALVRRDRELAERSGWLWLFDTHVLTGLHLLLRGQWEEALAAFRRAEELQVPCAFAELPWGYVMLARALLGDAEGVRATWEGHRAALPSPGEPVAMGRATAAACAVEALCTCGMWDQASSLYGLLGQLRAQGLAVFPWHLRLVDTALCLSAAAGGRWDDAERHHRDALRMAERMDAPLDTADLQRLHAAALLRRDGDGDAARARTMLDAAHATYARLGVRGHQRLVEEMLAAL